MVNPCKQGRLSIIAFYSAGMYSPLEPTGATPRVVRTVTVIIPTFRRPHAFVRAVRSVFAQRGFGLQLEIVAIDNDPAGSALYLMHALECEAPCRFVWAHEPAAGVATARNAGLSRAQGELVAFLDDDQEAEPGWLAALTQTQRETGADAVFGPIVPELATSVRAFRAAITRSYARANLSHARDVGGALFVRSRMLASRAPFPSAADTVGGEADAILMAARTSGARFVWSPTALVREHVDHERAQIGPALRRSFAAGQRRTRALRSAGVGGWAIPTNMALFALLIPVTLGAWLVGAPGREGLLARTARAAGAAAPWPLQHLYGAKALPTKPPRMRRRALARVPAL